MSAPSQFFGRHSMLGCNNDEYNTVERAIFVDDLYDNGHSNLIVTNDNHRGDGGRPSNDERERRINEQLLRNELRLSLANVHMHRPSKQDNICAYDRSNHIILIE